MEPAKAGGLPVIEGLLPERTIPTDVASHLAGVLVARHESEVVRCVGMQAQGWDPLFPFLAVNPVYRGAGVGRRRYEALADHARSQGVERAYLLTTAIAGLVESWGFRHIHSYRGPAASRSPSSDCVTALRSEDVPRACGLTNGAIGLPS